LEGLNKSKEKKIMDEEFTNPGRQVDRRLNFVRWRPIFLGVVSTELVLCHPSGAWNLWVVPYFKRINMLNEATSMTHKIISLTDTKLSISMEHKIIKLNETHNYQPR
jgi:hypothetical protein